MKTIIYILLIVATMVLGSVATADEITGPVVAVNGRNITVQTGDGRFDFDLTNYTGRRPKVGVTVTVWLERHVVTKLEIKAAGNSKK